MSTNAKKGFTFTKAKKIQRRLRMALMGPSNSGKTFSALLLAQELAGKNDRIALIDTEHGSASLYSDTFDFDTCPLDSYEPQNYMEAIDAAIDGHSVLIIDSLSHAWSGENGLLDQVRAVKGNKFTEGWGDVGTPLQNQLVKAILSAPVDVIVTMRTHTAYVVEVNDKGKSVPRRVGLKPVQREGLEYEFDIIGELTTDNVMTIVKTRMSSLQGKVIPKPDGRLAAQIRQWLSEGEPLDIEREGHIKEIRGIGEGLGYDVTKLDLMTQRKFHKDLVNLSAEEVNRVLSGLMDEKAKREESKA